MRDKTPKPQPKAAKLVNSSLEKIADLEAKLLKLKAKNIKLERALVASHGKLLKLEKENLRLAQDAKSSKTALGVIRATHCFPDISPGSFDEPEKA